MEGLLVAESRDGIHVGSLAGRVPTEENAGGHAHKERDADGPHADDQRPFQHGGDDSGENRADDDADDTT